MRVNNWMRRVLAGLLLLAGWHESTAQRRVNTQFLPYSEVGFGLGSSTYYGELAGYRRVVRSTFTLPRWNVGLMYTRHFTPKVAARASLTYARITGDDYKFNESDPLRQPAQFTRNLHFRNDLKEFALVGIYQFIEDGRNSLKRVQVTPYIFGGLALLAHSPEARNPTTEPDRQWVKLQPLGTEGQGQPNYPKPYSLVTLAIPVGVGITYKLNENFNIAAEVGFRYTLTDYLDDIGGRYPTDPALLTGQSAVFSNRSAEPTAARKGGDRLVGLEQVINNAGATEQYNRVDSGGMNDGYLLTSIQLHYIIPGKIKCPPLK